ncbi:MAG: hypothetical protein P8Q40_02840 [Candidatus Poseidonia sp.]|uniref:hypothetical protein n=1 Tax=Poseidonia sp. TaxID=2666344 RepID=UPI0030C13EFB|nr:hypothetical protein [Poseidonia sp.]
MAEKILLPPRPTFDGQVVALKQRIESISAQNRMARLLNQNFNTWLNGSSMSALNLTQELDKDKDGIISGDEFSDILSRMTGERPPEWVVELMFSFVDADPSTGIPVADWMAFLAANGLEIPDSMFELEIPLAGTLSSERTVYLVEQPIGFTAKFSIEVESYTITILQDGVSTPETFTTTSEEMDHPNSDQFILEPDEASTYKVSLSVLGKLLDAIEITVEAPLEEEWPEDDEIAEEPQSDAEEATVVTASGELSELISTVEQTRLRSDALKILETAPAYTFSGMVTGVSKTLLGEGDCRGGDTARCMSADGTMVQVMMKRREEPSFVNGQYVELSVQPVMWSVAVRELICKEL